MLDIYIHISYDAHSMSCPAGSCSSSSRSGSRSESLYSEAGTSSSRDSRSESLPVYVAAELHLDAVFRGLYWCMAYAYSADVSLLARCVQVVQSLPGIINGLVPARGGQYVKTNFL